MGGDVLARGGVYVLEEADTGIVRYVGQTNNFLIRMLQHAAHPVKGKLVFRKIYGSADLFERLIREQQLINHYGGPGGQLLNLRNAIGRGKLFEML